MDDAEFRAELLQAFENECREHLAAMRAALAGGALGGAALRDVFRRAHSLKGAARAVEVPAVEAVAHDLETLLFGFVEDGRALDPAAADAASRALDAIEAGRGRTEPPAQDVPAAPAPGATPDEVAAEAGLRIGATDLDRLLTTIQAIDDASRLDRFDAFARDADLLLARLQGHAAAATGAAGIELRRGIAALSAALGREASARSGLRRQADEAARSLREIAERVVLVRAEVVLSPLAAMTRELGREQGVELLVPVTGGELRLDRLVLQALRDPMIQMLRNAVSHNTRPGSGGGAPLGRVGISLTVLAGRLILVVADDGAGPDSAAIEATARRRGLLAAGAPVPDEAALLALVFEPGFSTAETADRLSGRGLGLSIVAEAARRLRGTASMRRARDGRGTELVVEVPLPARRQDLVMVAAGGHRFALPADAVVSVGRVAGSGFLLSGASAELLPGGGGEPIPLFRLGALFPGGASLAELATAAAPHPVVMLRDGAAVVAVLVDELLDVEALQVREPTVVGLDGELVDGVAVADGGVPVPVLFPRRLLPALRRAGAGDLAASSAARAGGPERQRRQPVVLVVDDSITTRTLEKSILQSQGFRVLIAVDGIEALAVLRTADQEIDVVVADVEMPRLDGFGLLAAMRDDPALRSIPTVLMTSRSGDEDVRRGLALGARAYIAKQEFDQATLIRTIGQLLP